MYWHRRRAKAAAGALGECISIVSVRAAARAGAVSFSNTEKKLVKGDCWFFLICGWYLGLWDTIFVLGGAVLICGLAGLGYYVSGCIQGKPDGPDAEKDAVAVLPFAAVPGIWIAAVRLRDIIRMTAMLRRFCL